MTLGERSESRVDTKLSSNRSYRIAVLAGDGIGKEVVPEGLRALDAAAKKFRFNLEFASFDFACVDYWLRHKRMMPEDWKEQLSRHDAIFFGAVGWPAIVPDHVSLWGSLIPMRREFDQYVNLRPVRLMPGAPCPLAIASRATLISMSCAKIPRANIPRSAAASSPARSAKPWCRR